jgi:uncharacterized membrane protein
MTTSILVYACLWIGLVTALVGGVFQSFSDFVMAGLMRAEPAGGIESMQHINRTVMRSVFLTSLLSLVPLTIGFGVYAWFNLGGLGQILILAASAIYFVFVFLVTMFGNVPMNNQLAAMAYASNEAGTYWNTYGRVWTGWNHVRTLGSVATAACFLIAATTFS